MCVCVGIYEITTVIAKRSIERVQEFPLVFSFFFFEGVERVMWDVIPLFLYAVHTNCSQTCTSYLFKGVTEKTKHT